MRKFLISLMAASMLVPAAASARDAEPRRGDRQQSERSERSERSKPDRPQRAERPARVERADRPVRTERADRPVRIERAERQPRAVRNTTVQRAERVRPAERTRRMERADGIIGGLRTTVRQQQERNAVETRRDRDGFDRLGDRIVQNGDRDWRRDRDRDRDWSRDWRHDHRYDWRNYRNRYSSLFRLGRYYDPYGWGYRRFSIGFSLWPSYYGSSFWLNDPWQYRLPPAYGPYRWVRYYDDALLVNIYTGQVVDVVYNFFW